MNRAALRLDQFEWEGGREQILVRGDNIGAQIILIPPFFEEMNFTRALLTDIGCALAEGGMASWLPDLPGTGESMASLETVRLADWRAAAAAAARHVAGRTGMRPHVASLRGGALIDDAVDGASWWRHAPATGASLLRHLERTAALGGEGAALAGYPLNDAMRAELRAAVPATVMPCAPASAPGNPLWRRAEPGRDRALAVRLAADIAAWIGQCAQG